METENPMTVDINKKLRKKFMSQLTKHQSRTIKCLVVVNNAYIIINITIMQHQLISDRLSSIQIISQFQKRIQLLTLQIYHFDHE